MGGDMMKRIALVMGVPILAFCTGARAEYVVTFQDGVDSYSGCEDSYISQTASGSNYGDASALKVHRERYST
jgi:hypothetical protein